MNDTPSNTPANDNPEVGILEWFEVGEYDRARRVFDQIEALGVETFRTGISWADWHVEGGREWYEWLVPAVDERGFELLPCFTFTPPSMGVEEKSSAPPRRLRDFADFLDQFVGQFGQHFDDVELWNEPNNQSEWDFRLDPDYEKFAEMIVDASYWCQQLDKRVVLGGLSPIDPNWLYNFWDHGGLEYVDVVGVHGFPNTWETQWDGWEAEIARIRETLDYVGQSADIWVTEAGYSTWAHDTFNQVLALDAVLEAPAERIYWYSAHDLDPARPAYDGFHLDEREYHFGLVDDEGRPKLTYRIWRDQGLEGIRRLADQGQAVGHPDIHLAETRGRRNLITGGAGFVGVNLARALAADGQQVTVYDDLSRPGVEHNIDALLEDYGRQVDLVPGDLRDRQTLAPVADRADAVFHLAGQTAVTTSLRDPSHDFEVNATGTVNLLERLRRRDSPPPVVFASTNKV
ncbi:MAG: GDP-mannose 4,6-dehydratase, partial [Bradymonadaceae bacterium]